ncbi:resuscitation-promoting factor [Nocardioides sp.]|uniref:resuscitation-promoting factor n=1 Tax=Nocardioides sp. TaxID=35761 RepID=UPI0027345810|nr:resuscitation-promoting factor [Nocardioides sp.]MDP3892303.1 transglycosylase family protein [Nocardioides sp.]
MRNSIARLTSSRTALVAVAAVVALAVGGTTLGYAVLGKSVTLTLDGENRSVTAFGSTVGDVLESEGIEVTGRDVVAPSVDEQVADGSRITVRFARPLELIVDGDKQKHWVTATDVDGALGEIGKRFSKADLSVSRGAGIDRAGMALEVVTPKKLNIKVGAKKVVQEELTALTVEDVLDELGVELGKRDKVKPAADQPVADGDEVVVTRIKVVREEVTGESIAHGTVTKKDDSKYSDEKSIDVEGKDGARDVTYRLRYVNGKLVARKVVSQDVRRKPVDEVVTVGTKDPTPAPNFAAGGTVWDRLAQCESGGNWSINTGNGYYGGLQFSASTWRSVGGSGLPHQHSRAEQIKRGQILQQRAGWGQWPHCSSKLGLR